MKGENHTPEELNILQYPDVETCFFRYVLASAYCHGKNVLDVTCGYGYGSNILNITSNSVMGIDRDKEALEYARKKYPSITFLDDDITDSRIVNQFDIVISIETFEHIPRHLVETYLQNLNKWVKEGGLIFITTPQRYGDTFSYRNGSHLFEYSPQEFMDLVTRNINGDYDFFGIQEIRMGLRGQLVSVMSPKINECHVMVAVIRNVRK